MKLDFTLNVYRILLLTIKNNGYTFLTFENWCKNKPTGKIIILRHDVDLKAENSLATAQIEADLRIQATYYFRTLPQSNNPQIINKIAALNHEIGYHYEDLSLFEGDVTKSIAHFEKQLNYFRTFYPVKTVCMHGSPTSKFDNRKIWEKASFDNYNIVGEPYFDFLNLNDIVYFTDTARMWDGDKYNVRDKPMNSSFQIKFDGIHSTYDLIYWFETSQNNNPVMITTHPQRWTDKKFDWMIELIFQNVKNILKAIIIQFKKAKTL